MEYKNFSYRKTNPYLIPVLLTIILVLVVSSTIAFFFDSNFGSGKIVMSGAVNIEAVGKGEAYESIEDTSTSNMLVTLGNNYKVLIPGMPISLDANVKVYRSTTKPLLRADFNAVLMDKTTGATVGNEYDQDFLVEMYTSLQSQIAENGWYLHSDGYFYYIGTNTKQGGATLLLEVDATESDVVVPFINKPIKFPESVTEEFSGFTVGFKIKFQGIQNYITVKGGDGTRLPNTIQNSLVIFNDFKNNAVNEYTDNAYFIISQTENGWEINPKSATNLPETVVLPSTTPDGEPITVIGDGFRGSTGIKNLVVPASYTAIEPYAFENSSVINVDMSLSNITTISENAFRNSMVDGIELPNNLRIIEERAFYQCLNLNSIVLPDSLIEINTQAFAWSALKAIYIPKNVNLIDYFSLGTQYITKIEVDNNNTNFYDINNMIITSDGKTLIAGATTFVDNNIYIPEGVITLYAYSLYHTKGKVYLPSTLMTIDSSALGSGINGIQIHEDNGYFYSDGYALFNAQKTELINIVVKDLSGQNYSLPNELQKINGTNIFTRVTIGTLNIGENLLLYDYDAYMNCNVQTINVSSNNPYIKDDNGKSIISKDGKILYKYANLNSATIYNVPSTVIKIAPNAFSYANNLTTVNVSGELNTISYGAFANCIKLININIPNSAQLLSDFAFQECTSIKQLMLYGNINSSLMLNCTSLTDVTFGETCETIGTRIFEGCSSLQTVEFENTAPPTLNGDLFSGCTSTNYKIYVPDEAVNAYKTYGHFVNYADRIYPVSQKPAT